jgi:dCMP deaminase
MDRPDWDEYFLSIARVVATRADCTRRQVGAVLVFGRRIVSTGYNGAPAGMPGCLAGACPRGRHYLVLTTPPVDSNNYAIERAITGELTFVPPGSLPSPECACGNPWPCPEYVEPGSDYNTGKGVCIAVHAEANALLYANRADCLGAVLYVTEPPCVGCAKLIAGAGVGRIVWPESP